MGATTEKLKVNLIVIRLRFGIEIKADTLSICSVLSILSVVSTLYKITFSHGRINQGRLRRIRIDCGRYGWTEEDQD